MKKTHRQTQEFQQLVDPFAGREGLIYARVSSKKQEQEGSGLVSQEGRCLHDLKLINVPHTKTFTDTYSGGGDFMKRPAMRELLGYIDANPHKKFLVVFDDLKRFARDVEFHFKLRHAFKSRDVSLRCLNYNFDDSPEGEFAELIMSGQAQLERKQNRRQVIQKMKARLELGYYCFGRKRGYTMTKDAVHGHILVPNEDAPLIKKALEGFASGTFVQQIDVARFLFENKFWKTRTAEVHLTETSKILRDVVYCGDVEYLPWEVARRPGKHKGIITLNTFESIQSRLKRGTSKTIIRQDISPEFPLRGLVLCTECGEKLTAANSRSRNKSLHPYYYCTKKGCSLRSKMIRKKNIENDFRSTLIRNRLKDSMDSVLRLTFDRVWREEVHDLQLRQRVQIRENKDREQEIRELTDLARQTRSDTVRTQYEHRIEEIAKEFESNQQDSTKRDLKVPYRTALNKATTMLKNPIKIWDSVDHVEKHRLFFFLFDDRLIYSKIEGFRTAESLSTIRIFEEFTKENSCDVDPRGVEPRTHPCHGCVLPLYYRPIRYGVSMVAPTLTIEPCRQVRPILRFNPLETFLRRYFPSRPFTLFTTSSSRRSVFTRNSLIPELTAFATVSILDEFVRRMIGTSFPHSSSCK